MLAAGKLTSRIFQCALTKNATSGARVVNIQSRRNLGGGHSHDVAHPKEPYAPKHHHHYPDKQYLFGIKPGDKAEGWEAPVWGVYAICFAIAAFGMGMKATGVEEFQSWARREAIARESVREGGGEVEFGKYYSKVTYTRPDLGKSVEQSEDSEE